MLEVTAQMFSRTVTIAFAIICSAGFILLLVRRKLRDLDKALFLAGVIYSSLGIMSFTFGSRAIPLAFVPASLGAAYLFKSKLGPYLKYAFIVLLVLAAFIPLHTTLSSPPILFQTKEDLVTANFMIEKYDWNPYSTILSFSGTRWYINPQVEWPSTLYDESSLGFQSSNIEVYDTIIYSVRLGKSFQELGVTPENTSRLILENYNIIYNSGFSYIAEKDR
jgi:hypothetical protein